MIGPPAVVSYKLHAPPVTEITEEKPGRRSPWLRWISIAVSVVAVGVGGSVMLQRWRQPERVRSDRGVVRVKLTTSNGTGFFVRGPDDAAYVVTAHHVVATGEAIRIERTVEPPGGPAYVEAYPEVEVVGFDTAADLAVLRIKNMRADRFDVLRLAHAPVKDESVQSYGFPASSLSKASGMMSKPGKVLSLVKFPVYDHETGAVVREDAIDGLLISAEIEPGFSGGPTCNVDGEVVGINVTKDVVHRAQNGAVSVTALHQLMNRIKPADPLAEITPADVKALLARIETEYLLLPIERRGSVPADEYISARDRPRLGEMLDEMRRLVHDTTRDPKTQLSGQAVLGIALMRLPGRPLATYTARSTREQLTVCELQQRELEEFFGNQAPHAADDGATPSRCSVLASRALMWDLTALALQWEGKVRDATVVKLETIDAENHTLRASVRFAGLDQLVDLWLATDGGRLRLKLFDNRGLPSGISATRVIAAAAFTGTWHRGEPRTKRIVRPNLEADVETDETLTISIATDGTVSATHQLRRHLARNGARLPCGSGTKLELGLEQSFNGALGNGSIVAFRQSEAKGLGAHMGRCWRELTYQPDQVAVFKIVDDKLVMHRTDGAAFPEAAEFHR